MTMARQRKLALLLPPSEGKATGGGGPPWRPGTMALPSLDPSRAVLLVAVAGGVADAPTMPARQRYTGVLYEELDPNGLPTALRHRFDAQALVVSGLWGAVAPADPVPAYKLKMGSSVPGLGKLSTWWRPGLTAALAQRLAGHVVWDLLPIEHAAAWTPAEVPVARRFTVRFVAADGTTVNHWNKLLKGALIRHLLEQQTADPAELVGFEHPAGYRYDPDASEAVKPGPGLASSIVFRQVGPNRAFKTSAAARRATR